MTFRAFLFPLLSILPAAHGQETVFRSVYDTATDTHVEVTALFSAPPAVGYLPVRVKAANNLKTPRSISIVSSSSNSYNASITAGSSQNIDIPAGKTVTRDILVPVCPPNDTGYSYGGELKIMLRGSMGSTVGNISIETSNDAPNTLLSESLYTPNASALDAAAASHSGRSYGRNKFAGKFSPKILPSDWLAWSGYDVVALTMEDWADIPPGPRSALVSWLRQGGRIIFVGDSSAASPTDLPQNHGLGSVARYATSTPKSLDAADFVSFVASAPSLPPIALSTSKNYSGAWPLAASFGSQSFNYFIFFIVAILFSILVGPVNLFVFAKSGKRHRLFITTPLISLGASLVMIALIILQDGIGGKGARIALMEIQQSEGGHTAHVHQEQISRSGVLLGPSFTVDPACLITPVVMNKSRWTRFTNDSSTKGAFDIQPSGGKLELSGSWWQSRSEQGQSLSAIVPTRGRIERGKDPGTWISSFAFPLETIWFRDGSGAWTKAANVKTGTPFHTTPASAKDVDDFLTKQANSFTARNAALFNTARTRNNSFVATSTAAPAVETLKSIRWKQTKTIITGIVE